jgi:hypothetical protein
MSERKSFVESAAYLSLGGVVGGLILGLIFGAVYLLQHIPACLK